MEKIKKLAIRNHSKASEKYVDVEFIYEENDKNLTISTSIPIEYRRTGTFIEDKDIDGYLEEVYKDIHPKNIKGWMINQSLFWKDKNSKVTKPFFDQLAKNFEWCCVNCTLPPNPNWARRIQDLKEFGYTISTNTKKSCKTCNKNTTHLILVPLKRGGITGYETWSPELRKRIISLLQSYDAYEAKQGKKEGLLPDHKFPEIRWDEQTKRESLEELTDDQIKHDFQLLSNQRNQQKREVCRKCYQTGNRGYPYGIKFFYKGSIEWDNKIPKRGKEAEKGCVGCGWYDLEKWRQELNKKN